MVILLLANIFIASAGYWDYVSVVGWFSLLHLLLICLLLAFLSDMRNSIAQLNSLAVNVYSVVFVQVG